MDISDTLIPNSDQLDAEDLAASGPRIFTIERVSKGNPEQPVQVYLAEFPRPWRPGRNMRRVLAHCLGKDSSKWIGVRVELYCDPDVMFGKEKVGGTRIRALSHINGTVHAPIIVGRGKRGTWPVKPLQATATEPLVTLTPEEFDALTVDQLRALWKPADAKMRTAIEERVKQLESEVSAEDAFEGPA